MNADLLEQLAARLDAADRHGGTPESSLPGFVAQQQFAPDLSYGRQAGPPAATARSAAVMMLLYPHHGRWHLPLTVRPSHMADHAGQISFPGGLTEANETSDVGAVRELKEELGVSDEVRVLGRLTEMYVFVSDFWVTPWVGMIDRRPEWRPNPQEVASLLEVPLDHLMDRSHGHRFVAERLGVRYTAPYFAWQAHKIWGATSMMLNELVELLRQLDES